MESNSGISSEEEKKKTEEISSEEEKKKAEEISSEEEKKKAEEISSEEENNALPEGDEGDEGDEEDEGDEDEVFNLAQRLLNAFSGENFVYQFLCWNCNTLIGERDDLTTGDEFSEIDIDILKSKRLFLCNNLQSVEEEQTTSLVTHTDKLGESIQTEDAILRCRGCDAEVGSKIVTVHGSHPIIREGLYVLMHGIPGIGVFVHRAVE